MRKLSIITIFYSLFLFSQDRSLVFTTGSPVGTEGFEINWDGSSGQSVSDQFFVEENMALEALKIYAVADTEPALMNVYLQKDDNGTPGVIVYEWQVDVAEENHSNNYFLIITTDLCIYLDENNYYWLTLQAADINSQVTWIYSNSPFYYYSTSIDQGDNWDSIQYGNCGALSIWAETIYEGLELTGDVNGDFLVDVLDVITIIGNILGNIELTDDQMEIADLNDDGDINILDVVAVVNEILGPPLQLSTWLYEDINPNSEYFEQMIGPETFVGNVSLYYFGKAG